MVGKAGQDRASLKDECMAQFNNLIIAKLQFSVVFDIPLNLVSIIYKLFTRNLCSQNFNNPSIFTFQHHNISEILCYCTYKYMYCSYAFSLQGLATINSEVANLAAKAREGRLQPHEFQVNNQCIFVICIESEISLILFQKYTY